MTGKLFDRKVHGTRMTLWTERGPDGLLVIAGQDIGRAPSEIFGSDDYEYRYVLSGDSERELRDRLLERLGMGRGAAVDEVAASLLERAFLTGMFDDPGDVRLFMDDHGIEYSFSSR